MRPTEFATFAVITALLLAALAFPSDRVPLLITAVLLAVYVVLWFRLLPPDAFGDKHFLIGTLITQAVAVQLLAMTGGATSNYFTLYQLGILATVLRPQPMTSAVVGVVSVTAHVAVALAPLVSGEAVPLERVVSRTFSLIVIAAFVVVVARAFEVARTELSARTKALDSLVDTAPVAVVTLDGAGRITRWNGAAARMFGRREWEVRGRVLADVLSPPELRGEQADDATAFLAPPDPELAHQPREVNARHTDGSDLPVEILLSAVRSDDGWSYTAFITDITARRQRLQELERLSEEDPLTGLANRRYFYARLRQVVELAERQHTSLAVLLTDLNGLKRVNDVFGHQAGDGLIRGFGERLRMQVRESDTAARLGGDEFACVLPGNDLATGRVVAEKILRSCDAPFTIDGREIKAGLSIGVAVFPGDGESADELLHAADLAMYSAKRQGLGIGQVSHPNGN